MSAICSACGSGMDFWNAEGPYCVICENAGLHKRIKELVEALERITAKGRHINYPDSAPYLLYNAKEMAEIAAAALKRADA